MRKIAVVTSSRADYSHLYWPLKHIDQHPALDLQLIVFGAHLSPGFGLTVDEIRQDGFSIAASLECLLHSDTDVGMAKTIGLATLSLADELSRLRPDILLVIADRYEMLAAATVALALRIPIAHIEGGEISAGAIDDAIRNALTKMSHLHFTPHQQAAERVQSMGEEAWRVSVSGAPSLDHLQHLKFVDRQQLSDTLDLPNGDPLIVVAYHPVTLKQNTTCETDAVFAALSMLPGALVFCFPNADSGSYEIIERVGDFCQRRSDAKMYINLPARQYFNVMHIADVMLGNSSSAIMEAASFKLPVVDIGLRQQGRLCADNIIQSAADSIAIVQATEKALSASFQKQIREMENPYGSGQAGEHIAQCLADCPVGERLLFKNTITC